MSLNSASITSGTPGTVYRPVSDGGLWRGSLALALISVVGFGLLYSLAGVGLGQLLFPQAANGSLIKHDGRLVGSALVAQPFSGPRYFQSRPSAAGYDVMALAASNQARTNPELAQRIDTSVAELAKRYAVDPSAVPGDLVTWSGSGIDPHISPAAAAIQIDSVARARGIARQVVADLVALHTEGRQWDLLGQPRVNVLQLNLALDALASTTADQSTNKQVTPRS